MLLFLSVALNALVFLAGVIVLVFRLGQRRATRYVDLSEPGALLREWVAQAAAFGDKKALHRHIIKHAAELVDEIEGSGTYETWSASMHNLLAIFDAAHGIDPDADLCLERMTAKYLSDPSAHTAPPAPVPQQTIDNARGPTIEKRRKLQAELERATYYRGGY